MQRSPTALFFSKLCLRSCYNPHIFTPEKWHSTTVGREPSSVVPAAMRAKSVLLRECYGDHTMQYHPSKNVVSVLLLALAK